MSERENGMVDLFLHLFPEHNFRWRWGDSNSAVGVCCFHEDKSPSLAVYKSKKKNEWRWWCYSDQFGGTYVDLVMRAHSCTRFEANRWLGANGYIQETEEEVAERERQEIYTKFYKYLNGLLVNDPRAAGVRAYIVSRNIPLSLLPKAALGWYPPAEEVAIWCEQHGVRTDVRRELAIEAKQKTKVKIASGAIAFFYRQSFDQFSRIKLRNVMLEKEQTDKTDKKNKAVIVLGARSDTDRDIGFFTPLLTYSRAEQALVVEGEFDAYAVFSLCYAEDEHVEEPIYCFGSGGNLEKGVEMLSNLGVSNVYVFPDNDAPGMDYVFQVTVAHPHTFVIFPEDYEVDSDPAAWAMGHSFSDLKCAYNKRIPAPMWFGRRLATSYANGTQEDQSHAKEKILEYARSLSPTAREQFLKEFAPLAGVSLESLMSELTDLDRVKYKTNLTRDAFGIYMLSPAKKGEAPYWERIANVIIEFVKDILYDDGDGLEPERHMVLKMMMADRTTIATISAKDYTDLRSFEQFVLQKLGHSVWIKPKSIVYVKEAATMLSRGTEFREDLVYRHTGWRGKKFYMPNGYIDSDGFHTFEETGERVELPPTPPFFTKYRMSSPPADIASISNTIREGLLKCYSYSITLPSLAHAFLAPLMDLYPAIKPTCLWYYGQTGSHKSSYAACINSFFGDFSLARSPQTWRSTINSIEKFGFYLKDVIYMVDDFKKQFVREDLIVPLIQNYGDGTARSRLRADLGAQKLWPIRGLLLSTGEDLPCGESSTMARCIILNFPRSADMVALSKAQKAAPMYPGVMAKFIQYLSGLAISPEQTESNVRERQLLFKSVKHPRAQEGLAGNSIAWDFAAKFLGLEDLTPAYYDAMDTIIKSANEYIQEERASTMFIEMLRELLGTRRFYLEGRAGLQSTDHEDGALRIGWVNKDDIYLLGKLTVGIVNEYRTRAYGSSMKYSTKAIYDQLCVDGVLIPWPEGTTAARTIDGVHHRLIRLRKEVLLSSDENARYNAKLDASEIRVDEDAPLLQ